MKFTKGIGTLIQTISGVMVGAKLTAAGSGALAGALASMGVVPPDWLVAVTTISGMFAGVQAFKKNPDGTPASVAYAPPAKPVGK